MRIFKTALLGFLSVVATVTALGQIGGGGVGGVPTSLSSSTTIGGQNVCLEDGTNCDLTWNGTSVAATGSVQSASIASDNAGLDIYDTSGDNPRIELYQDDTTTRNAFIEANGTAGLVIESEPHGAPVSIRAENNAGTNTNGLIFDPDGTLTGYFAGVQSFSTRSGGLNIYDTASDDPRLEFYQDDATTRNAFIEANGAAGLVIESEVHGALVTIRAENNAGTNTNGLVFDPDDDVALFDADTEVARTLPAASGGFEVNNTSTGAGFERVLTVSDLAASDTIFVLKDSAQSVNNSTTLVTDTALTHTFTETGYYEIEMVFRVTTANPTPNFKFEISGGSSNARMAVMYPTDTSGGSANLTFSNAVTTSILAPGTHNMVVVKGYMDITGLPETFDFEWAQDTAHASNTTVNVGSYLKLTRMGDT